MSNNHRKGSAWRRSVELWLVDAGFATTVRGIGYQGDDLLAVEHDDHGLRLSIEAKNHKEITLARFVDQSVTQAGTYRESTLPVCVIHRPGRAEVDDAYVVMPGWAFIELVTR